MISAPQLLLMANLFQVSEFQQPLLRTNAFCKAGGQDRLGLGSKTENFREELPLLITRMGDSFVDMMAPQFQVYAAACL